MSSRLTGMAKTNTRIFALVVGTMALYPLVPSALAQDAIRVEANEVLVPVYVVNKERFRSRKGILPTVTEDPDVIPGLTVADFHVFEDDKEQSIQNVSYEVTPSYGLRDSRGYHAEFVGEGGGKWSSREYPPWLVGYLEGHHYVIAYTPSESLLGSCHRVRVTVNRRNALTILARSEYCNTKHSPSDPLNGTDFGKQLERDLASAKRNNVDVSLLAVAFYAERNPARVHIALDWSWKSLKSKSDTVGILGIVSGKDGSLVTRFSDVCEVDYLCRHNSSDDEFGPQWDHILTRYETQVNLPSGEYNIRVVLGDGTKFGRAEIPLTIDDYNRNELATSGVSLCKQVSDAYDYSPRHAPRLPGSWTTKLPGNYVPLISDDIEFKPTADTRFKKDETLYTYFEVYEPLLATEPSTTVDFRVRIVDMKTGELRSDSPPVSATPYAKVGSPVIPIGRRTNISNLPKGSYRLDVQATDSAGKTTPWRSVNFTVE